MIFVQLGVVSVIEVDREVVVGGIGLGNVHLGDGLRQGRRGQEVGEQNAAFKKEKKALKFLVSEKNECDILMLVKIMIF